MSSISLDDVVSAVRGIAAHPVAELPDAVVAAEVTTLRELADAAETAYLTRIAAFHARGLGQADGLSTRAWLRHNANVAPGEATRAIKTATGLAALPDTAAALVDGMVRPGHAAAMVDAAAMLGADVVGEAEGALIEAAGRLDPARLRTALRGYGAAVDDPAAVRAAEHRDENRWLDIAATIDGAVAIQGVLGAEDGAILTTAIDALTKPAGADDSRTAAQRRADALTQLCRHQLGCDQLPAHGGEPIHLLVTTDLATFDRATEKRRGGHGALADGTVLSGDSVRRMACDAKITRIVLGSASMPLDVGRAQRTVTPAQRKALRVRDGGCVFPGCDRPPEWCDAHHINFWSRGGRTDLAELTLLCRKHHTVVHEGRWHIQLTGRGRFSFISPHGEIVEAGRHTTSTALLAKMLALDDNTL